MNLYDIPLYGNNGHVYADLGHGIYMDFYLNAQILCGELVLKKGRIRLASPLSGEINESLFINGIYQMLSMVAPILEEKFG